MIIYEGTIHRGCTHDVREGTMHGFFTVLDVLLELNSQQRPVFVYAFSNGGCAVFFHIMEALEYS